MSAAHAMMSSVFVLNPGSSGLKWAIYATESVAATNVDASIEIRSVAAGVQSPIDIARLLSHFTQRYRFLAVVVRVVHGGDQFFGPLCVSENNISRLKQLNALAPLHNPVSVALIEQLYHHIPTYAVFDTEFFRDLPLVARTYGLPRDLNEKHHLRLYGFHGFAHESMLRQWHMLPGNASVSKVVTLQLGSGCSAAAILNNQSIDTTMGFTPNEGLLMRTRSGDLDAGLVTWLQREEGWSPEETDEVLNQCSGWKGLSGGIENMAQLFDDSNDSSRLAVAIFIYRIQKTLGAYFAVLGGLDGIVLAGGIAEHNVKLCHQLLSGLEHLGIHLRPLDPKAKQPLPLCLSTKSSHVQCWRVAVDEAAAMLRSVKKHPLFVQSMIVQPANS